MSLAEHVGDVFVPVEMIRFRQDLMIKLFEGGLVVRCEYLYNPASFHYTLWHPKFPKVDYMKSTPRYGLLRFYEKWKTANEDGAEVFDHTELVRVEFNLDGEKNLDHYSARKS